MSSLTQTATAAESCFVEASAGTGKTRELVQQIVRAIAAGVAVDRIVAVTFTHTAAGEMKLRVRQELDRARSQPGVDATVAERLARGLQTLDRAFIGTIHSFCAQLLRRHPVEACVDPSFEELSQQDALRVFAGVFRGWIERKLAQPSPALRRALARLAWMSERETGGEPLDALRSCAWRLAEWRDHPAKWMRLDFDRDGQIRELNEGARALVQMRNRCPRPGDPLYRALQPLADYVARVHTAEMAGATDFDVMESDLIRLPYDLKWLPNVSGSFGEGLSRDAVVRSVQEFLGRIEEFRKSADAQLAPELRDELWESVELYGATKRRAGQVDFLDLLIFARDLLRNDHARRDLQARYDRLYIDEFQDTDPLQAEILMLLCADDAAEDDWQRARPAPGKLFVVGDPKQSIYRFRRADAGLYERVRGNLTGNGMAERKLSRSHRSVAPIQQFVNAAFDQAIPNYLPLEGGPPAPESQPAVVALPMPRPYGSRNISKAAINACSPDAVAAFIEWLIHSSGWTVRDPDSAERIPIGAEHVCVLFRRFTNRGTDLTQEYVRCLEARGINHVLVGSKSFHQREEVGTMRTVLRAIEWPDDELSVYAVLRGSLFSIADATLLKFKHLYRRFSPWLELPEDLDEEFAPVREALHLLRDLHHQRNYRPIADTMNEVLEFTRAHAGFALRKGGERVLANVYRLADLARTFDVSSATSFRSFVEYLEEEAASGETTEAPVLEQQAGGVKLMTVHRAKGLEFPVVILADLTAHLSATGGADRYIDQDRGLCAQRLLGCAPKELVDRLEEESAADRDEALRVAYVAATRARDLLVVATVGERQPDDSWLSPLYDAVYPANAEWRVSRPAPGCPPMGDSTVLNRPMEIREELSVRPGLHVSKTGGHDIVWFDPALLTRSEAKEQGLDRDELLQGDAAQVRQGLADHDEWLQARRGALEAGERASVRSRLIAEIGEVPEAAGIPVEVISVPSSALRPAGRRFGRLVHAILQTARTVDDVERATRLQARKLGATDDEVAAAGEAARTALLHPALRAAQGFEQRREFPVALRLADGTIAEGNLDLAWYDGERWTVVDYKTDVAGRKRYRQQLQVYGLALAHATNQPVHCVLLEV